mmetsp:Transcript_77/g.144  ORF Transcript_77/g.144 Transcript_77/m.144 type:complete len:105 (+) Transcript_77:1361-1675(+)
MVWFYVSKKQSFLIIEYRNWPTRYSKDNHTIFTESSAVANNTGIATSVVVVQEFENKSFFFLFLFMTVSGGRPGRSLPWCCYCERQGSGQKQLCNLHTKTKIWH